MPQTQRTEADVSQQHSKPNRPTGPRYYSCQPRPPEHQAHTPDLCSESKRPSSPTRPAKPTKIQNVRASYSEFFATAAEACAFRVTALFSNTSFAHDSALAAAPCAAPTEAISQLLASPFLPLPLPLPLPLAMTLLRNCTS